MKFAGVDSHVYKGAPLYIYVIYIIRQKSHEYSKMCESQKDGPTLL